MMSMTIGQEIASKAGAKLAAGGLIGALALGGGAMATGQLSCDTANPAPGEVTGQMFVETGLAGAEDDQYDVQRIEVEGLGVVDVALRGTEVEVIDLRADDGGSAEVRPQGQGGTEIDFTLGGVTRTLLVSVIDGQLFADLAPSGVSDFVTSVDGTVEAGDQARVDVTADAALSSDSDAALNVEGDVNTNGDVLDQAQAETGLLGGLGIDLDLDD
jgi:hypothetical protein